MSEYTEMVERLRVEQNDQTWRQTAMERDLRQLVALLDQVVNPAEHWRRTEGAA